MNRRSAQRKQSFAERAVEPLWAMLQQCRIAFRTCAKYAFASGFEPMAPQWLTLPQDLIGLPAFTVLALSLFDPRLLFTRRSRPRAAIALDLLHPDAKAVRRAAQFTRDSCQRRRFAAP